MNTPNDEIHVVNMPEDTFFAAMEIVRIEEQYPAMTALAYNLRGLCHTQLGNYRAALSDFSHAIIRSPYTVHFWTDRARVFLAIHRYERVLRDCYVALMMQRFVHSDDWLHARRHCYPYSLAISLIAQAEHQLGHNLLPEPKKKNDIFYEAAVLAEIEQFVLSIPYTSIREAILV